MQVPQLRGFMRDFGGRGTISIRNFIAGLAEEEKVDGEERTWKGGDQGLGGFFSDLPSAELS